MDLLADITSSLAWQLATVDTLLDYWTTSNIDEFGFDRIDRSDSSQSVSLSYTVDFSPRYGHAV